MIQRIKNTKDREAYIKNNKLETSFIDDRQLYSLRPSIPDKEVVGTADNGDIIFFEESFASLRERHYGRIFKPSKYNLLFLHEGQKAQRVTREYLQTHDIEYFEGHAESELYAHIAKYERYEKRSIPLEPRYTRSYRATAKEHELLKEFLKRLRSNNEG